MRKETSNLLKVIGEDREYGTHGSVPIYHMLAYSIEDGKDKAGLFKGIDLRRRIQRFAFEETIPFFNALSDTAFVRLMHFAQEVGFDDVKMGQKIKQAYVLDPNSPKQLEKRSNFIVTYSESDTPSFTEKELIREKEVRRVHPWSWIDAMDEVNPKTSRRYIIEQVAIEQDIKPLLVRLPYYMKTRPGGLAYVERLVNELGDYLPSSKMIELHRWISRRKDNPKFKVL